MLNLKEGLFAYFPAMKSLSLNTLALVSILLLGAFIVYQPWQEGILGGADSSGYYAYLPAFFIHQDIMTMDLSNQTRRTYRERGRTKTEKLDNGNHLNQYTCGVAILNLPAFALAHLYCKLTDYSADGYAPPYNFAIVFSGLLYVLAGLLFLRAFLLPYFTEKEISLSFILLALGTNLYFTAVLQGAMAHGYLFFLVSALLWATQKWHISQQSKYSLLVAFITGLIILVRPNVIIVALIPLFMASNAILKLLKKPIYLFVAIALFLLPFIPQFLYWKMVTGHYITYSYGSQSFDFLHPHLLEGLLGFKNGWLLYSPLMLSAVIGFLIGCFKKNKMAMLFLLVSTIHIYIIYSWWCWNYINGFGSRAMVDIYPILIFPVALFFHFLKKIKVLEKAFYLILLFFIGLNIFQTHQNYQKVLWSEGASSAYYFSVFGKSQLDHDALVALDCNVRQAKGLSFIKELAREDFESPGMTNRDTTLFVSGKYSFCIRPGQEFSSGIQTTIPQAENYRNHWLRISAQCQSSRYATFYENSQLVISINRNGQDILWKSIRINNKIRTEYYSVHNGEINQWKEVSFFIPLKGLKIKSTDIVSVYGWNSSTIPVYLDDLKLEIWTK